MLGNMLDNLRKKAPTIHSITNYVTVNDCANILLACGAAPIMADDPEEVAEITALCAGLNLNIGTLNARTIPAMQLAGRQAMALGRPIVLDPVGAGASRLRTQTAQELLSALRISVLRGNISEIKSLALGAGSTKGVEADRLDAVTAENLPASLDFIQSFARQMGAVVAVTGAIDIVADGTRAFCIFNGHPMLGKITGAGCMLSAMTAAYVAANPEKPLEAVAAAVCAMGLCGELAQARLDSREGSGSFRTYLLDAVYHLQAADLEKGARYELR